MRQFKNLVVIVSILIVIIIIILGVLISINNKKDVKNTTNIDNTQTQILQSLDIKEAINIESIINNMIISSFGIYDDGEDEYNSEEIVNSNEFLSSFNIDNGEFSINNINVIDINSRYRVCFASGDIIYSKYDEYENEEIAKQTAIFTVIENKETEEYSVEIYGKNYQNIFNYNNNITEITYESEKLQEFEPATELNSLLEDQEELTDKEVVMWLYEKYKKYSLHFAEDTYNMLDEAYKQKRFYNSFEEFREYLEEYNSAIEIAELSKYSKNEMDGYTLYTLVDTINNSYFVKIPNDSIECKYLLDNYTIPYEGFIEKYNNMSDEEKVSANIQTFINMIKTNDYKHAYGVLNDTFKSNNFNSLNDFKKFIKDNLFANITVSDLEINKADNYYEGKITLVNTGDTDIVETKTLTIIMQLKEGTDFVMSFSLE